MGLPNLLYCIYNCISKLIIHRTLIIRVNICGVRIGALKGIMAKSPVVGSGVWICAALCLSICYKTDRWVPGKE